MLGEGHPPALQSCGGGQGPDLSASGSHAGSWGSAGDTRGVRPRGLCSSFPPLPPSSSPLAEQFKNRGAGTGKECQRRTEKEDGCYRTFFLALRALVLLRTSSDSQQGGHMGHRVLRRYTVRKVPWLKEP